MKFFVSFAFVACAVLGSNNALADTILVIEFVGNEHTVVRAFYPATNNHEDDLKTEPSGIRKPVKVILEVEGERTWWYIDDPKYVSVPVSKDGKHGHARLSEGSYILRLAGTVRTYQSLSLEFEDGSVENIKM